MYINTVIANIQCKQIRLVSISDPFMNIIGSSNGQANVVYVFLELNDDMIIYKYPPEETKGKGIIKRTVL